MITGESAALNATTYTKVAADNTAFFYIENTNAVTAYIKFTTADEAPTGKAGAIVLKQGQSISRGSFSGYVWALAHYGTATTLSVTE